MKRIITIIFLFTFLITYKACGQTSALYLSQLDSLSYSQLRASEIVGIGYYTGGQFLYRKASMYAWWRSSQEFMAGNTTTFTEPQTFNDPIIAGDFNQAYVWIPPDAIYYSTLGSADKPYKYIYGNQFTLINPSLTDSLEIFFTDSTLQFSADKKILFPSFEVVEDDSILLSSSSYGDVVIKATGSVGGNGGIQAGETVVVEEAEPGSTPSFGFAADGNRSDLLPPEVMISSWDWDLPNKSGTIALTNDIDSLGINMPSDSTGLSTGTLYFDSSGIVRRKF